MQRKLYYKRFFRSSLSVLTLIDCFCVFWLEELSVYCDRGDMLLSYFSYSFQATPLNKNRAVEISKKRTWKLRADLFHVSPGQRVMALPRSVEEHNHE